MACDEGERAIAQTHHPTSPAALCHRHGEGEVEPVAACSGRRFHPGYRRVCRESGTGSSDTLLPSEGSARCHAGARRRWDGGICDQLIAACVTDPCCWHAFRHAYVAATAACSFPMLAYSRDVCPCRGNTCYRALRLSAVLCRCVTVLTVESKVKRRLSVRCTSLGP